MHRFERSSKDVAGDDNSRCIALRRPYERANRIVGNRSGGIGLAQRVFSMMAIAGTVATAGALHATRATAREGSEPAHLHWAKRLVAELTPERNAYAWSPTYVVWNEDNNGSARNRSVCSSFVSHDLERAYGFGRSELVKRFGMANPQAKDYYATIAAERGFERISRLADARPGDIIAVRYPAGSHPTGHVMILDGFAHRRSSTEPVVEGTTQYEAAVIDSSHSFHGLRDTRYHGNGKPGGGVGRGTLRLYAGADGSIAGYAWSTRRVSKFYDTKERELIIGRFQPAYAGASASPVDSGEGDASEDSGFTQE